MEYRTAASTVLASRPRGPERAVLGFVKYHLRPLTILETAAAAAALVLGWKEVAVAILIWHVVRMGLSYGLGHGLRHGHGLGHWHWHWHRG